MFDFNALNSLLNLTRSLDYKNEVSWNDFFGSTEIILGRGAFLEFLNELVMKSHNFKLITNPKVEKIINYFPNNTYFDVEGKIIEYLISIGSAYEQNIAKELLLNTSDYLTYISVPVPLSNDSFCTNMCSPEVNNVEVSSRRSQYPSKIIIDLELVEKVDENLNRLGIGEVVGLYYSIHDYFIKRNSFPPFNFLNIYEKRIRMLAVLLQNNDELWMRNLAVLLILKSLLSKIGQT